MAIRDFRRIDVCCQSLSDDCPFLRRQLNDSIEVANTHEERYLAGVGMLERKRMNCAKCIRSVAQTRVSRFIRHRLAVSRRQAIDLGPKFRWQALIGEASV